MHDVPPSGMSGPALPTAVGVMTKTEDEDRKDIPALTMEKSDPSVETEAFSVGSESSPEPDHIKLSLSNHSQQLGTTTEKLSSPQPVTPESPRVEENESKALDAICMPEIAGTSESPSSAESTLQVPDASAKELQKKNSEADAKSNSETNESNDHESSLSPQELQGKASDDNNADSTRASKPTSGGSSRSRRSSRGRKYVDDASSSDDDSYFATHLPSPKSGRSFSYSSTGSVGGGAPLYRNSSSRESDASLSFSDESEDGGHHTGVHVSPMIHPKGAVADMSLYPQRITRMHSVSSLVSSDSSNDLGEAQVATRRASLSTASSQASSGSAGDQASPNQGSEIGDQQATGVGTYGIPGSFFPPSQQLMSPTPMMQSFTPQQPLVMTQNQMDLWVDQSKSTMPQQGYGAVERSPPGMNLGPENLQDTANRNGPSTNYVYSDDDDTMQAHPFHQLAGGASMPGAPLPAQASDFQNGASAAGMPQMPDTTGSKAFQEARNASRNAVAASAATDGTSLAKGSSDDRGFQVYWRRWLMLFYMSILNLLSDWTCYSVAPISLLTEEAFGNIDPERLVVVFLGANAIASISEPIILSRLGLRRTVLFGALLLMIGSIVKSGGVPPILQSDMTVGHSEWRLYLGFFLVGLSQPLYQCTPTLLSSSWFPEEERTMATGVALNANQLGIGFAFVFGTLLVERKEDIIPYFGLLSTISTIIFLGALAQFDDAPPTPPSSSARVVRGTLDVKLPDINKIVESVRGGFVPKESTTGPSRRASPEGLNPAESGTAMDASASKRKESKSRKSGRKGSSTRRRATQSRTSATTTNDSGLGAPSSALGGSTFGAIAEMARIRREAMRRGVLPPSPMMSGRPDSTDGASDQQSYDDSSRLYDDSPPPSLEAGGMQAPVGEGTIYPGFQGMPPPGMFPDGRSPPPGAVPGFVPYANQQYPYPYWDPRVQQQMQQQQAYYQQQFYYYQQMAPQSHPNAPPPQMPPPYFYPPMPYAPQYGGYDYRQPEFMGTSSLDDGAEPVLTITPHHLDIDIRDDQVIRSLRACFARQGFVHALVAFTASGIVINTLSTYMDYLVRLNGAPRTYTGIVGGTFQFVIMISSLIIGKFTDHSRAYYSITIAMLVLGAFGLAECGVSLDSDKGDDLRWTLIIVAALVGPLQPVSTELGVDVVYPLSENTVLVIQQLFSNLLSALFIPIFKSLKDVGSDHIDDSEMFERPEYTFSFYLLIVIHTAATIFFATFNGKYLRYEHELQKKDEEEQREQMERDQRAAVHPLFRDEESFSGYEGEQQPLMSNPIGT